MRSRKAGLWFSVASLSIVATLADLHIAITQETRLRATVDTPLKVPIDRSASVANQKSGGLQLIVTVTGFEPSPNGPVQAVVEAQCGSTKMEIGRFGIMPQVAFRSSDPSKAQNFSLVLPEDSVCRRPDSVTIRLVPSHGNGHGASVEIGAVELQ
jgi:hypothetical protein